MLIYMPLAFKLRYLEVSVVIVYRVQFAACCSFSIPFTCLCRAPISQAGWQICPLERLIKWHVLINWRENLQWLEPWNFSQLPYIMIDGRGPSTRKISNYQLSIVYNHRPDSVKHGTALTHGCSPSVLYKVAAISAEVTVISSPEVLCLRRALQTFLHVYFLLNSWQIYRPYKSSCKSLKHLMSTIPSVNQKMQTTGSVINASRVQAVC